MKLFLLIFSIILAKISYSQNSVIEFANSHMNKKVGTGVCDDFVNQAENTRYKDWDRDYWLKKDSLKAHQISFYDAQPGDVVLFNNVVLSDSTIMNHIGIVGELNGDTLGYVSQNQGCHTDKQQKVIYKGEEMNVFKNSKVQYVEINVKNIIGGEIDIFRF